jgi:hypothetical protein
MGIDNIAAAIEAMETFPELQGDEFVLSVTGEFGEGKAIPSDDQPVYDRLRAIGRFSAVTVNVLRLGADGKKFTAVTLLLHRAESKITVTVSSHIGLEKEPERALAQRIAEPFPFRESSSGADEEVEALKKELRHLVDEARRGATETANLAKSLKDTVRESTIRHHAAVFRREAIQHNQLARRWYAVAVGSVAVLLAVAVSFFVIKIEGNDAQIAGQILARITLLSIPASSLGVAVRQYSAARHNWVVATHRSNALWSYQAFAEATEDKSAKDSLLAPAIALIFTPKHTGYSKAVSSTETTFLFAELIKNLTGQKGGA